jgi:hypothetical protein
MIIELDISHSDKDRAEVFLHSLNEEFEQLPFDWRSMEESKRIVDAVKLTNMSKTLVITLLFLESYWDADIIAKANSLAHTVRWGCNGSLMYLVESADQDKVNDVLGAFAGRE